MGKGHLLDANQFIHEILVDMEPPGRIQNHHLIPSMPCTLHGVNAYLLGILRTLGANHLHLELPAQAIGSGFALALLVGVISGMLPALSAMRLRVVTAMRRV